MCGEGLAGGHCDDETLLAPFAVWLVRVLERGRRPRPLGLCKPHASLDLIENDFLLTMESMLFDVPASLGSCWRRSVMHHFDGSREERFMLLHKVMRLCCAKPRASTSLSRKERGCP